MGTYSWFLTSRNNAEGCKVDWDAMNTAILFESYVLHDCFLHKELFPTLLEVAKRFDDTKLMGYFTEELIAALCEFNKHLVPYGSFPRIYYEYEGDDEVWCLEFIPGMKFVNLLRFHYGYLMPVGDEANYEEARQTILSTLPERANWRLSALQ
jgi:hypothetical protein